MGNLRRFGQLEIVILFGAIDYASNPNIAGILRQSPVKQQ